MRASDESAREAVAQRVGGREPPVAPPMIRGVPDEPFEVLVPSTQAAEAEVAELWVGGEQFGHTLLQDGRVTLRIEPRADGAAWEVGAHHLRTALARAAELLGAG